MESAVTAFLPDLISALLLLPLYILGMFADGLLATLECGGSVSFLEMLALAGALYAVTEDVWTGVGLVAFSAVEMFGVAMLCWNVGSYQGSAEVIKDFVLLGLKRNPQA